jgi:hypothetical protein
MQYMVFKLALHLRYIYNIKFIRLPNFDFRYTIIHSSKQSTPDTIALNIHFKLSFPRSCAIGL